MQPVAHCLQWVAVDGRVDPPRYPPKQPFGAKAQSPEDGEVEEGPGPPVFTVDRTVAGGGSLELVGQIGDGAGQSNDLFADRAGLGI